MPPYSHCAESATPQCAGVVPVDKLDRTGGHFFWQGTFAIGQTTQLVVDFKNSSVIGRFHHRIFDDHGRLVAETEGGIQSREPSPFFLRHGREFTLQPGHYQLVTEISSPFFLAQPTPYLDTLAHYQLAIQTGDALTLLCMGVLLGLMFYYAVLAGIRRNATDGFYALFILGNLLYNGTALLLFPNLFGLHWFYLISFPILLSNGSYVLFVLRLLDIASESNPRLYRLGMALLGLFAVFVLLALFKPNWSLELDRAGVGLFLGYGLLSGIVRNRQGHFSAPMYLAAVLVFFVLGALSISLGRLGGVYTIYIEHLGLLAVTVEVLLLALVLARQFSQLRMQYERAHLNATHDALTDLQNRRGFIEAGISEVERSKRYDHPLSLIYLDLDNFKQLNDMWGHSIGDAALSVIANALRSTLRSNDLIARMGGDEFAMLLPEISQEAATEVGNKIFAAVNNALRDFPPVTASIGAIHFTKVTWTFSDIMEVADELMYEVKKNGKNNVNFRHYD
ncbi:diguanylate cyclase [Ferrovum sp.]|uniref:sensor domain-containing diguanylate cyclase n=1 Tax=Ferrovum sp. TaxID=2609467 RepID=UPI00261307CF|nr:diguanylate cyclase [Ferrovum sp.]